MKEITRRKLKITNKQKEARAAVDTFTSQNGYPPSYREVQELLNLASPNTAYHRLRGYRHKMVKQSPKTAKK